MTDPRDVHSAHLDAETIAALVDRTLDPAARAAAEAHLAGCADCRDVWMDTSEIAHDTEVGGWASTPAAADAPSPRGRSRRWIYGGAGIAASVVIAAGVWSYVRGSETQRALQQLQPPGATTRFVEARLSIPLSYLPPPQTERGTDAPPPASVRRSALLLQERADSERSASALHSAGIGLLATGDPDRAVEYLSAAAAESPERADLHADLAAGLLARWRHGGEAIDATRAVDAARRATLIEPANAAAQFNLALAFQAAGLLGQARTALERSLELDPASPWTEEVRQRLRQLDGAGGSPDDSHSQFYRILENEILARWAADVVLGRFPDLGPLRAASLEMTGPTMDAAARMTVARALAGNASSSEARCLARAVNALGDWNRAFEAGKSEDAVRAANAARDQFVCAGMPTIDADSRAAISLVELSRLAEADTLAASVIATEAGEGFGRAMARALQVRGLIAQQEARFSDAVDLSQSAIEAATAVRDVEFAAALETHLASLFSKQGDIRTAWRHLAVALSAERSITSLRRKYSVLARAALSAGELRLPAAMLAFSEALLDSTGAWPNPVGHALAHLKRAEALTQLGHRDLAMAALLDTKRLLTRVPSAGVRANLQAQTNLTEGTLTDEHAQAVAALDDAVTYFTDTDNRIMLAPALLERGGRFARAGDTRRAGEDWRRGVAIIEDQRAEIRDAQLQISRIDRVWELFEELTALTAASDALAALEITERGRARQLLDSLSREQQLHPLRGRALHSWLPGDGDALVYAALPDRLLIWHLTKTTVRLESRQVSRASLNARVTRFRDALRSNSQDALTGLEQLILPSGFVPRRSLIVVADGPLHALPFAALRLDDAFLAERTIVVNGASLTTAATSQFLRRSAPSPLLVGVGRAVPSEGLAQLSSVGPEITDLSGLYPNSVVLSDDMASREAVLAALPRHDLFHFAGHAVVDAVYPSRSKLVLGGPGESRWITAGEIASTRLMPGTVVVLGACDTANGGIARGEGALALSRAFLAAGAATVVGSLWKLRDDEGRRFLIDLHRALARAPSAADALAVAQRAWIASGADSAVWASFQVTGGAPSDRSPS